MHCAEDGMEITDMTARGPYLVVCVFAYKFSVGSMSIIIGAAA